MNQLVAQLRLHSSDLKKGMIIFWTVLVAIVVGFYSIAALFDTPEMYVTTNVPLFVFMAITDFKLVKDDFDYSIHLGLTRNKFVLGSLVYILLVAILFNLINQLLLFITISTQEGVLPHFLTPFTWSAVLGDEAGFWTNFSLDFILSMFFSFLLYFMASLLFRFGQLAVYIALLVMILVVLIPTVHQEIFISAAAFYQGTSLTLIWALLSAVIIVPILSLFTLSKASV